MQHNDLVNKGISRTQRTGVMGFGWKQSFQINIQKGIYEKKCRLWKASLDQYIILYLLLEKVPFLWKLMLRTLVILSAVLCILVDWVFADNVIFKT